MSGGFFDYSGNLDSSADEIHKIILENKSFQGETIMKLKLAENVLRLAQIAIHRIDWFMSGDDGEDEFNERWDEDLRDYIRNCWGV